MISMDKFWEVVRQGMWLLVLWLVWVSLATFCIWLLAGCAENQQDDPVVDSGSVDTVVDSETEQETEVLELPPCELGRDPDTDEPYYSNYPLGPYGFKGSICKFEQVGTNNEVNIYLGDGDTMHKICLPDKEGKRTCLSDIGSKDLDFIFVRFASLNCNVCLLELADQELVIKDLLDTYGLRIKFFTVLDGGSVEDIKILEDRYGDLSPIVLDAENDWQWRWLHDSWRSDETRGLPFNAIVNAKNKKVFHTFAGWYYSPYSFTGFYGPVLQAMLEHESLTVEPVYAQ